mmetsp:Transcript_24446/g.40518  ORF Transcript_24446/g.40518 Transcript_24446/m.40518 type:complete len:281 (+) Transcript_24446:46-888(+)
MDELQSAPRRDYLLLGWNIGAGSSIVVPLLIYIIAVLVRGPLEEGSQDQNDDDQSSSSSWWQWGNNNNNNNYDDDGNNQNNNNNNQNNNNQNSGWWWWSRNNEEDQDRRREENQGKGAVIFAYLWTLLVFGALVWYGNLVFRRNAHPLPLVSAMVVFWNMSFIGAILVGNVGINYEERELEEQGWLSQFGACLTLTYICLLLFCTIFILWIRRRTKNSNMAPVYGTAGQQQQQQQQSNVNNHKTPTTAISVTDEYHHQESNALEQREPSTTNKPPWAAFY